MSALAGAGVLIAGGAGLIGSHIADRLVEERLITFRYGDVRDRRLVASLMPGTLRDFNVYGPRMDTHGVYTEVMIRWIEALEEGEQPKIFGDGGQSMNFVYVDDVAAANVLAAKRPVTREVINVASERETTLLELLETLLRVMDAGVEPELLPERKVRRRRPALLEEGLRRLVAWTRTSGGRAVAAEAR